MAEIEDHTDHPCLGLQLTSSDFNLIEGKQGEFSIWKDDQLIYSKKHGAAFPSAAEVLGLF